MNRINPEDRVKVLKSNSRMSNVVARIGQEGIYKGEGKVVFDDGDYWYYAKEELQLVAKAKDSVKTPWYEDIPEQGVLCIVGDDDIEPILLRVIIAYSPYQEYKFQADNEVWWADAKPITKEEVLKLIY